MDGDNPLTTALTLGVVMETVYASGLGEDGV